MFKIEWKTVLKIWFKTLLKDIAPLFASAAAELFKELVESYNKDNLKNLAELREKGEELLKEQQKKFNGEQYNL